MAHELALKNDGTAAMAFVGETPWHGLGQSLTLGASIEEWTEAAGFNWDAVTAPVTYTDLQGKAHAFEDKKILFRSDTGAALSVVGDGYQIVQPREVLEFFRKLTEEQGWNLHTAGVMRDGRRLWAMATRGHHAEIVRGDFIHENLMLATSLDGTLATHARETSVRVVCANTLRAAMDEQGKRGVRVSHRQAFDAEAVRAALLDADGAFRSQVEQMKTLAEKRVTLEQARDILRGIFGQPLTVKAPKSDPAAAALIAIAKAKGTAAAPLFEEREQKSVARSLELYAGEGRGANMVGVKGTAWGLLNAVTEHIDHEQGRGQTRLESAFFGRGDVFKQKALDALIAA